jgi:hypothetical protein
MKKLVIVFIALAFSACMKEEPADTTDRSGYTAQNGSITRFVIEGNLMYAIDFNYLKIFNLTNNDNPVLIGNIKVGYGLETIFVHNKYVYIGANNGVYVISAENPMHPIQLQQIQHHISCDPVVVAGNYAYSTKRTSATGCGTTWQTSSLTVYDVTSPTNATLIKDILMEQPYGLAVQDNWLYVCDPGKGGIVVYNISDPANPIEATIATVEEPRDIILMYPYMIVSTNSAYSLYNYADPMHIYLISSLIIS